MPLKNEGGGWIEETSSTPLASDRQPKVRTRAAAKARDGAEPAHLGDRAYRLIKRDFVQCVLAPGAEVSEARLAEDYGLGRGPVRWALVRLCQEGLFEAVPRRGYRVKPITIKSIRDNFELRLIIEGAAARLAAGRIDAAHLRAICKGPSLSDPAQRDVAFLDANHRFHVAIAEATGNEQLVRTNAALLDRMARYVHLGLFPPERAPAAIELDHEAQQRQHEALIEALDRGDADAAERAARQHVEHTRDLVVKAIFESRLPIGP